MVKYFIKISKETTWSKIISSNWNSSKIRVGGMKVSDWELSQT